MKTENISTLKINRLTQAQYDREKANDNLDENALYLTEGSPEGGTGGDTGVDKITRIDTYGASPEQTEIHTEGISWKQDYSMYNTDNVSLSDGAIEQSVPIVAGENVTFELDEENQVVKVNAEGGTGTAVSVNGVVQESWNADSKLDKQTAAAGKQYIYGFNGPAQTTFPMDVSWGANYIPIRDSVGNVYAPPLAQQEQSGGRGYVSGLYVEKIVDDKLANAGGGKLYIHGINIVGASSEGFAIEGNIAYYRTTNIEMTKDEIISNIAVAIRNFLFGQISDAEISPLPVYSVIHSSINNVASINIATAINGVLTNNVIINGEDIEYEYIGIMEV